jgi:hypothetical protein
MKTCVLSLIHADHSVPVGELTPEHIQAARRKIQNILTKAGITNYIGGIDFSANEDENGAFEPYYQIQSWILAPTNQVNSAERELRKLFPRSENIPRPVIIQKWDGDQAALGYALKSEFDRRVCIMCEDKSGLRNSYRDTRDRHLRVEQQIELLIALDRAGLHARLHLGGCRVVRTLNGPQIRMIESKQMGESRDDE